ncbi:MAG: pantoate--beta-alanine ligase [Sphingomonadales bacterium]|nr:pantoate--beta-alanine ligase [Sphingomonadales bacterium]
MQTIHQLDPLRRAVSELRKDGPLALVPTMGALHDGHLTLVRQARLAAKHVAVSIFVNPRQFGVGEDLAAYPRQLARDVELLSAEGVSLVWAPTMKVMYPDGYATNVSVSGVSEDLCGAERPGHFDGVATVVAKLFNQVRPDMAFFGEKDWQQLAVIRRMARDLDLVRPYADDIHGIATVREADGLAMSSRNAYLTPEQRVQAAALPLAMREAVGALESGADIAATLAALEQKLLAGGFASVDYAALRDSDSLLPVTTLDGAGARLLVAARIGRARLIDNMPVAGPDRAGA